jgi:hypothetical protein
MKRRNPLLTGLLNMLIPGSSHLYVSKNWLKFILFFIIYSAMIVFVIFLGNNIQRIREYTLPQGLCTGILLLGVYAFLFFNGMNEASARNGEIDSTAHYQAMRTDTSKDDVITKLAKLQRQRDEGLISIEQQETREADIKSKKE